MQIEIKTSDDLEKKISDLRKEFQKLREENYSKSKTESQESRGFIKKGLNPDLVEGKKYEPQGNVRDSFLFAENISPPVSNQIGNLQMLTNLTNPSKVLLHDQTNTQRKNSQGLYVTVVQNNKTPDFLVNVGVLLFILSYFLILRL